jgi:hypothetical protein
MQSVKMLSNGAAVEPFDDLFSLLRGKRPFRALLKLLWAAIPLTGSIRHSKQQKSHN